MAICQIDGPNLTPMPDITGRPVAMHAIAAGKVLLASLPERTVLSIARRGLVQYTPRTITDRVRSSKSWRWCDDVGTPLPRASGMSDSQPPPSLSAMRAGP